MPRQERNIVHIDEDKCNGCGLCVPSCAEGAIQIVNGKAKLVSDVYCDGLGACLGPCPTGAISIVSRDAEDFDAEAAEKHIAARKSAAPQAPAAEKLPCGCPGSLSRSLKSTPACECSCETMTVNNNTMTAPAKSELVNWPVKLRLLPPGAPYLEGADLLLMADCAALAVPDLHKRFLADRPVAIACPKFDDAEAHIEKLAEIITRNSLSSLTVVRMEVPCCGGLVRIAEEAIRRSGRDIPLNVSIISVDGSNIR